jgi:hypothetical protein
LFPFLKNPTQEKTRKRKEKKRTTKQTLLLKRVPDTPPTKPTPSRSSNRGLASPKELGTRYLRAKYRCGYRFGRIDGGPENRFENLRRTYFGSEIRSGNRIEVSSLKELGTRYLRTKIRLGYRFVNIGGGPENRFENLKDSFWLGS